MKQKKFNKKLVVKKTTIADLTKKEQLSIRAGDDGTVQGRTCDAETQIETCQ